MAEFVTLDEMTAIVMNKKSVYIGAGAPGTPYDGQVWVNTTTDPPILEIYDNDNTQWMVYNPTYYETQSVEAWASPTVTPVTNGTIVIKYNSHAAVLATRIYIYSNSAWTYVDTVATAPNWFDNIIDYKLNEESAANDTVAGSVSRAGFLYYDTLTIDGGVELTLTGDVAGIMCNTFVNNGTLTKSATGSVGGTASGGGTGVGGAGGGELFIVAKTIDNNGLIRANGVNGTAATNVTGDGNGGDTLGLTIVRYSTHSVGTGGKGGSGNGNDAYAGVGTTNGAGGGGGGAVGRYGGDATAVTYVTFASATDLDRFIVGSFMSESAHEYSGGGGGGGASENAAGCGGGGGGGGGAIYICANTIDNTGGTLQANGGSGGAQGSEGGTDSPGGGGGGGIIYVFYETLTAAGTSTCTGGASGGASDGTLSDAGTAGTATAVQVTR